MGLFDNIFQKINKKTSYAKMLNGYAPVFSQFGSNIYASDVVQQAINCIVSEMKKLNPQHVIEKDSDISPVVADRQRMLMNPNPIMTKSDFLEKITWMLLLHYNVFIIPIYDSYVDDNGNIKKKYRAMYPVQPTTVEFREDVNGTVYVYMKFLNQYETELPYDDIIHLRHHYSVNEFLGGNINGEPDYQSLLKTLQINEDLMTGIGGAMRSSFAVNGIVKYNTMLDKGKTMAAMQELEDKLLANKSGFLPLDLSAEFTPISRNVKMVDKDTLEFIDNKILRHFGVPLNILTGDYTPAQYEAFYQKTLEPMITSWSDEFTRVLFTDRERSFGNKIRFYPKDLIFMSIDQTIEMVRLLGDSGTLYENEKRISFGLRPLPELVGVRMMSKNYGTVESVQNMDLMNAGIKAKDDGGGDDGES